MAKNFLTSFTLPMTSEVEKNRPDIILLDLNMPKKDGREALEEIKSHSFFAKQRCDPYAHLFYFKNLCQADAMVATVAWTFDTSINGGPLLRIVDEEDACTLLYKPFSHNEWIKIPSKDSVPVIGPVGKNQYRPL